MDLTFLLKKMQLFCLLMKMHLYFCIWLFTQVSTQLFAQLFTGYPLVEIFVASVHPGGGTSQFFGQVTSPMYKACLKHILVKIKVFGHAFQNDPFYSVKRLKQFYLSPVSEWNICTKSKFPNTCNSCWCIYL